MKKRSSPFPETTTVSTGFKLAEFASLPFKGTPGSAGLDVSAFILPSFVQLKDKFFQKNQLKLKTTLDIKNHKDEPTYLTAVLTLRPGERALIPLGFAMSIEPGFFTAICGRSGLALKGIEPFSPGIIDSDFRGELRVLIKNDSNEDFEIRGPKLKFTGDEADLSAAIHVEGDTLEAWRTIPSSDFEFVEKGDRIAQLIMSRVYEVEQVYFDESSSDRGSGSFGSTGKR